MTIYVRCFTTTIITLQVRWLTCGLHFLFVPRFFFVILYYYSIFLSSVYHLKLSGQKHVYKILVTQKYRLGRMYVPISLAESDSDHPWSQLNCQDDIHKAVRYIHVTVVEPWVIQDKTVSSLSSTNNCDRLSRIRRKWAATSGYWPSGSPNVFLSNSSIAEATFSTNCRLQHKQQTN